MSGPALGWAFKNVPFLKNATEKLVLLKLAHRANITASDPSKVWPGVDCTAADLAISRQSVLRAQKRLEKIGLIIVERRKNISSNIYLQLDFLLDVGAMVAPPAKQKQKVTKSHPVGAKVAPPSVPPWHPNQTMNKTMNKKQQHPAVVVFENLVWEKPLSAEEKAACEFFLAATQLPLETCQKFADEMAGDGRRAPIRNPVGWIKNMIDRYGREGFSFAYSAQVAAGRAGRAAQAQRESLAPPPPRPAPPSVLSLSQIGRAELNKMGRHLKPAPPQVEATHASANLADAACKSAIAVAGLSGESTPAN